MNRRFFSGTGILAIILLMLSNNVTAQDQPAEWTDGELEDVEIEIIKERQITLPKANRNFEKIPPRAAEPIKPPITYNFKPFDFRTPEIVPQIRPLRLKQEDNAEAYGSYVSLGYGNYASPYAEAFLNTRKDKQRLVGAHAWLKTSGKGPVDGKNSGSGTSGITAYGKTFGDVISLGGEVGYENRTTHFYGYPATEVVDAGDIRQAYNIFSIGGDMSNTKNADFKYGLGGKFSHLTDKYDARETVVDLNFRSEYELDEDVMLELKAAYSVFSRKDAEVEPSPRNLFQVSGAYVFAPMEGLRVSAGLIVAYENDTLESKDLHLFPDLRATYAISPTVDLVGALTGGIDKVSLHSLSAENWWLGPNVPLNHTNRTFEFLAGIHARLGNKVEVQAGLAAANLANQYYFVNSPDDQSRFTVVYDEGTTKRNNVYGSLSYAQSERTKFNFRGDFYTYTTDEIQEAWHRPTYRLAAHGYHNIFDKIIVKADLILQGGMKALDTQTPTPQVVKLDGAIDLNAKAEYLFSETFSFFVQFNNLTANQYPLYYHYPARGFQVLGGINWSF